MLGFPTEIKEEIQQTIDYACYSSLDLASFFIVPPMKTQNRIIRLKTPLPLG